MFTNMIHFNIEDCSDNSQLISLRFPQKLWKIVNECQTGAIQWNAHGNAIIINYTKFQRDYLDSDQDTFKTSNLTSFIRQLNLYGFRKVTGHGRSSSSSENNSSDCDDETHEFRNHNFLQGREDLLIFVSRKTGNAHSKTQRLDKRSNKKRGRPSGNGAAHGCRPTTSANRQTQNAANPMSRVVFSNQNTRRIKTCQKALTDALKQAALKNEMHNARYQEFDGQKSILDDATEAMVDKYAQYAESELLIGHEFPQSWDHLSWCDEGESIFESVRCVEEVAGDGIFETIKSEDIGICNITRCGSNDAARNLETDDSDRQEPRQPPSGAEAPVSADVEIARGRQRKGTVDGDRVDATDNSRNCSVMDFQVAWDNVMEQMDNTFAEKIYEMLMSTDDDSTGMGSSDGITVLPDVAPAKNSARVESEAYEDPMDCSTRQYEGRPLSEDGSAGLRPDFSKGIYVDTSSYIDHNAPHIITDGGPYSLCFDLLHGLDQN